MFALADEGWGPSEVARELGVTPAAISKIIAKRGPKAEAPEAEPIEIIPPPVRPRIVSPPVAPEPEPIQPKPHEASGSEWRGIQLAGILGERRRQLLILQGEEVARDFCRRECWHMVRTGVTVESISQQFDLPTAEIEKLIAEARQRAIDSVTAFDARLSLAAALDDVELSRRECLRVLNSPNSTPTARASARRTLLECSEKQIAMAVTVEAYRAAHGLSDPADTEGAGVGTVEFWLSRKVAQR